MKTGILFTLLGIIIISGCMSSIPMPTDPFGAFPKGTSPNCGPENRYKYDTEINSKDDVVNFLKENRANIVDDRGNRWLYLDNFKEQPPEKFNDYEQIKGFQAQEPDWQKVTDAIQITQVYGRTVYVLEYKPIECHTYTFKITNEGHASNYGCCGE